MPSGEAAQAVNLRRREKSVEVVGNPVKIGNVPAGHKIVCIHHGHYVTWHTGGLYCDGSLFFKTDAKVLEAHSIGRFLVVNTSHGLAYFTGTDGELSHLNVSDAIPELHLGAIDTGSISEDLPQYDFSTPLATWHAPLSAADVQMMAAIIRDASRHLQKRAKGNGTHTRPLLARYGVRLTSDKYLWISAPVLIGHTTMQSQYRTQSDATTSGGHYTGITATTLSLPTFKLAVSVVKGTAPEWIDAVKSVDIFITDEADVADTTLLDYRIATTSVGTRRYIAEFGPEPRSAGEVMGELMNSKWHLVASCTNIKALAEGVFSAWGTTQNPTALLPGIPAFTLSQPATIAPTLTNAECARIISNTCEAHLPACTLSHGGRLWCGGGSKRLVAAWQPSAWFMPPFSAKPCTITLTEKMATDQGEATITTTRTYPFTPSAVNPLACAPHTTATSLRMEVSGDQSTKAAECALTPLHASGMAATFTPDLLPLTLYDDEPEKASTHGAIISTPGALTVSDIAQPITAAYSQTVTGVELTALAATERPIYSGGFGRYPLYLFTDHGIFIVPQKSDGTFGEAQLMSRKLIDAQARPVSGGGKIWFVSTHHWLCSIEGSKIKTVTTVAESVTGLAWSDAEQELWQISADGTLRITDESGFSSCLTLSAASLYHDGQRALAVLPDGSVHDICTSTPAEQTISLLTHPILLGTNLASQPAHIIWNIFGEGLHLSLLLLGERGESCHGFTLCGAKVNGNVGAPISLPVVTIPTRTVRLCISGTAPSGTIIRATDLYIRNK